MENDLLNFDEVVQAHELAKQRHPAFQQMSLADFAKMGDQALGRPVFSAGATSAVGRGIKNISGSFDALLEPVGTVVGAGMENLGNRFSPKVGQVSRQVGEGLPRAVADMAMVLGPGAPLKLAGLASGAAKAYSDTGSPVAGGVAALGLGTLPKFAGAGIQAATRLSKPLGAATEKVAGGGFAGLLERGIEYGGAQAGGLVNQELVRQGTNAALGQFKEGLNPFTEENILPTAIGSLAFGVVDAPMLARGYRASADGSPTPFSLLNALSPERPIARSLADYQRQQSAVAEVRHQVAKQERDAVNTLKMDPSSLDKFDEDAAIQDMLSEGNPNTLPTEADLVQRINTIPDPQIKDALTRFQEVLNAVPDEQPTKPVVAPEATVTLPGQPAAETPKATPKAKSKKGGKKPDALAEALTQGEDQAAKASESDSNLLEGDDLNEAELQAELQADLDAVPTVVTKKELLPVMDKVHEVSNGNMEQVARSAEALVKEPITPEMVGSKQIDVDIAKNAALKRAQELGVAPGASPQEVLLKSTEQFFTKLFTIRGHSPEENVRLTNIAVKMAMMAGEQNLGTQVVNNPNPGENFTGFGKPGLVNSIVSLSKVNVGMGREVENALSFFSFGHELSHLALQNPGDKLGQLVAELRVAAKQNTPEENAVITETLLRSVFPREFIPEEMMKGASQARQEIYAQGDSSEAISDWAGLLAMGLTSKSPAQIKNLSDALMFGPDRVRDFSNALYSDLSSVLDGVAAFTQSQTANKGVGDRTATALANVKSLLLHNASTERMVNAVREIASRQAPRVFENDLPTVSRDLYRSLIQKDDSIKELDLGETFKMFKQAGEFLTKAGWESKSKLYKFGQNFVPMGQRAKSNPEIRPIVDLGYSFASIATKMSEKMFAPFLDKSGKLDEKFMVRMMNPSEGVNRALNELALKMNEAERWYSDEEFAAATKGLSKDDQAFVKDAVHRVSQANQMAAAERVRGYETQIKNMMTTIVMQKAHMFGRKVTEAEADAISESIYSSTILGQPAQARTGDVPVEVLRRLTNYSQSMKMPLENFKEAMLGKGGAGKPWWTSEVRLGNHYLSWKDDQGKPVVVAYNSKFDANKRKLAEESKGRKVSEWNKHDRFEAFKDLSPDLVQRYAAADKVLFEKALAHIDITPEIRKDLEDLYQPGMGASEMITPPSLQQRELVGGREELNLMAGVIHYLNSTAMGLAKRYVKGRVPIALHTPELRLESNRGLQNEMRTYIQDIINMPGKELHTLKNMVFFNYLAGNLSAMLVEPTQQFIAHVPYLVREGAGVGQAYKEVLGSLPEAASYAWTSKGPSKVTDPLKHKNILRAIEEQVINKGFLQDVSQFEDVNVVNLHNLATGGPMVKAGNLAKNKLYWVFAAMRNMYAASTQLNSAAAFISSYDFHLKRALKSESSAEAAHEAAYNFARTAVRTTMYGGGRAARPLGIAKFGQAQGIASLAYSLQSYTFNTMSMMARLGREMISRSVPKEEQASARKAFGLMMGTQFLLGGALGLPLTSAVIGLIDQFYPEAELRKKLRSGSDSVGEYLGSLVSDDAELGQTLSTGVLNGIGNALGPIDFGSRFQLGNAFGVNSFDGFSFQNLFGPAANMMANYTKGASAALSGDLQELKRNIAPASVRGLVELHHNDWKERDRQGKLLFEPTATELAARVVGFRPRRLNEHYEKIRIMRQSEEVMSKKVQRFHEELADLLAQGNGEAVRQQLLTKAQELPGYDPRSGARRVVEIVQDRSTPVDVSRQGRKITADENARILGTFQPGGVSRPNEVQLLQQRKLLERQIGIPGAGRLSRGEISQASMVDRLMQMNPVLTTRQAKAMVEQMMSPRRF
jgi:hypothetical protein